MQTKQMIVVGAIVVMVGVGGFLVGKSTATATSSRFPQYGTGMPGGQRNGTGQGTNTRSNTMMRYRPVNGEIIESGDDSVTVKLMDGTSKIVLFSDKTEINKAQQAQTADLKVGEKVMVMGQENSDGSVTAQNIQLNPVFRGQMGLTATPTQ
jgi:hypothetical protein